MRYTLRPYQSEAVELTREKIRGGHRRPLIVAPTGAGKTVIACSIIESAVAKGSRVLFLAHRKELITQCSNKLHEIGVDHGIIKAGIKPRPYAPVQVASVQTLTRRLDKHQVRYDLIIVDEAHHAMAKTYLKILNAFPLAITIGLTATPYRSDGKGLGDLFDSLVEVTTVERLMEDGHLVPVRVFAGLTADLSRIPISKGDYATGATGKAYEEPEIVGDIVAEYQRLSNGRTAVVFAATVASSQRIVEEFVAAGIAAEHLDGETDDDTRDAILARLGSGETMVVSNVGVLTEGWDLPRCSCVIFARPTKSRGLWRQMAGRALRPAPGKTDCHLHDHAGVTREHGFISDADSISLHDGVKATKKGEAKVYSCPSCNVHLKSWPLLCPSCGEPLPREARQSSEIVEDRTVKLEEVSPQQLRRNYISYLIGVAQTRKYSAGWVNWKFKERFGEFPTGKDQRGLPIRTKFVEGDGGIRQLSFVGEAGELTEEKLA